MPKASIRELKSNLSKYLQQVQQGTAIIITKHGKPIARIIPETTSAQQRMQSLVLSGMISWNGQKPQPREPIVKNLASGNIADLISEDRNVELLIG